MTVRVLPAVATAAPAVVLAVVSAGMLVAAAVGDHPLWITELVNLSEAAALRDRAEVVRLIADGEDPNAPRIVRPGFLLDDRSVTVTPMEAAIAARRAEVVFVLLRHGAAVDSPGWNRLRCLARIAEEEDTVQVLDRWRSSDAPPQCVGITAPWAAR